MSSTTVEKSENISNLLALDQEYAAPEIVARNVVQKNWKGESARAQKYPEVFWADYASQFSWARKWDRVLEWDGVHHKWFTGAKTNITVNALDRHANSDRRNRAAFIWLGEDGSERIVTYGQLHRMVCRFANGLKSLGVVKGDRVVIYMPLTIEGAVAMLACARIGAIHSVVYAGLGHTALQDRIVDAQAKVIIAGDVGFRRGKTVALKAIVDEAVETLDFVEKIVVYSRAKTELAAPREIDFNDLLKFSPDCPAEEMDAEDPLFLLYTSGSTGKPKGVVHVHGGYMVGTTYHLESFFDVGERDIFWCTSDIGWVVGHSYIVYGPLANGATVVMYEGAPNWPEPDRFWDIIERLKVYRLCAVVRGRHHHVPRRRHRLPESRRRVGNRRALRRHQDVYRSHRSAHVHALWRKLSRCA